MATGIIPTLQNVLATVDLDCKLDLKQIALKTRNSKYNPGRFPGLIVRIREPKTTALIFSSGKIVCTGAKSEDNSRNAAKKFAMILDKLGFAVKFKNFKIQNINILASCDVKFVIRLEQLALSNHRNFIRYEPEIFPGLIYRMKDPKRVKTH